VQNCISSGDAEKAERFQDFARDLLAVGDGTYRFAGRAVPTESTSKMQIPPYVVWKPPTGEQHSPDALFDFIYSPMRKQDGESDNVWEGRRNQYLWNTAVLVSRNIEATEIKHRLLDVVNGNLDANGERWVANRAYREILPKYTCVVACKTQDSIRATPRGVWRTRTFKTGPNGEAIERASLLVRM
jgi:hypothetical protein